MSRQTSLPNALDAPIRDLRGRAGRVALYASGTGTPVLLIHSVNAAASAYEIRPIFDRLIESHRVFAIDLPGFGASDRSDRPYNVDLFVAAIDDALDAIEAECGNQPVDVLALSLSSEFAARVATRRPQRFRTLALVSATGLDRRSASLKGPEGSNREVRGVYATTSFSLWSQSLFDGLVSRPSMRYFLQRTWGSKAIDEGLMEYSYLAAHQPGARFAPLAFLSGRLFSADIRTVYERLAMPVWLAHGVRGDFQDYSGTDWTRSRANWSIQVFQTGALPHFEQPGQFVSAWRRFAAVAFVRPD
jgi:pimeloyl-ACP methyl ester carboxylesterase